MKNPYESQAGGSHYTAMGYQPSQLAFDCAGPASFQCVAKYTTRDKNGQAKQLDLKKALHFVQIEAHEYNERNKNNWPYYNVRGLDLIENIQKFASQFPHSDLIEGALVALAMANYEDAYGHIQLLITFTE